MCPCIRYEPGDGEGEGGGLGFRFRVRVNSYEPGPMSREDVVERV